MKRILGKGVSLKIIKQELELIVVLFLLLMLNPLGFGQQGSEPCKLCDDSGWVSCKSKDHPSPKKCRLKSKHMCSLIVKAKCCYGENQVPCNACLDQKAQKKHRALGKKARAWRKKNREVSRDTGVRFSHVQIGNVIFHCSFRNWRFQKIGTLKQGPATHVFAQRVQTIAKEFESELGATLRQPIELFLCASYAEMLATARIYAPSKTKATSPFRSASLGVPRAFIFPAGKDTYVDKGLHSHLAHQAAHLLVQASTKNLSKIPPPWLDVGIAHWFEFRHFKGNSGCTTFCLGRYYADPKWDQPRKWARGLSKRFRGKNVISFAALEKKEFLKFDHFDHALSWSLVSSLLRQRPEKFKKFFQVWSQTQNIGFAVREGFGLSMEEFNAQWHKDCKAGKL